MPIREYLAGKSFDPEMLAILNEAFQGACRDLGVTEQTPQSRANVAKAILQFADGQHDPRLIRAAAVRFLKGGSSAPDAS
jgi:hypothetical protein